MNWILIGEFAYVLIVIATCLRVIYDTDSTSKVYPYLMLVIFLPVVGILFYFSFGVNYRHRKLFEKKVLDNKAFEETIRENIRRHSEEVMDKSKGITTDKEKMARMLINDNMSPLTSDNDVEVYINGEEKFPAVIQALEAAQDHIHIQYYIYDDDEIGRSIHDILVRKAKEGIEVRLIYDDFGSRGVRKKMVPELNAAGAKAAAFYKIRFYLLASRINYRNHRKIIVIDGEVGFVGGINVSNHYVNDRGFDQKYWRDTHLRIAGPGIIYLQYLFISDWNFCAEEKLALDDRFFPPNLGRADDTHGCVVQIAASGPDSDRPTILYSLYEAIHEADKELLITTPYFIPTQGLMDALIIAALSEVEVHLLVPYSSDSKLVDAVARSNFRSLIRAGVRVHRYTKGMIHSKTMVVDSQISIIGSANLDIRSFDLNFEVNAIVYDEAIAEKMRDAFHTDLEESEEITREEWEERPVWKVMLDRMARLLSPFM